MKQKVKINTLLIAQHSKITTIYSDQEKNEKIKFSFKLKQLAAWGEETMSSKTGMLHAKH